MTVIGRERAVPRGYAVEVIWVKTDREAAQSTECHLCRSGLDREGAHWFCPRCRAASLMDSAEHKQARFEFFKHLYDEDANEKYEKEWLKAWRGVAMYG